ncbi:hypothetical protein [Bradyrhizobium sp. AUGA SZCCT0283]|uniref:hypothetical protein n=1 Tax=Bradyrhizobium sp. AUGA SZCCT0283 TaxID=2807671 RepID=UPI001BA90EF9|nr:hypothetical protein [Bradyrhizobium sp. AUGA SZCCT0283]MBR1280153.1 hypothetical protein [Bradyrhizobium sp. AUGA SZCCT0283]
MVAKSELLTELGLFEMQATIPRFRDSGGAAKKRSSDVRGSAASIGMRPETVGAFMVHLIFGGASIFKAVVDVGLP